MPETIVVGDSVDNGVEVSVLIGIKYRSDVSEILSQFLVARKALGPRPCLPEFRNGQRIVWSLSRFRSNAMSVTVGSRRDSLERLSWTIDAALGVVRLLYRDIFEVTMALLRKMTGNLRIYSCSRVTVLCYIST